MGNVYHKDLTGTDLHEPKPHASSHNVGGVDSLYDYYALLSGTNPFTGYVKFGSGTTTHSLSLAGDVLVSNSLEVDSDTYFDSDVWVDTIVNNSSDYITINNINASKVSLYLDGFTTFGTTTGEAITDGYFKLWRGLNKTMTAGETDLLISAAQFNSGSLTVDTGNSTHNGYGIYFLTIPNNNSISGVTTGKISWNDYAANYWAGVHVYGTTTIDAASEVNYNSGGCVAVASANLTLNNALLDFTYAAYGVKGTGTLAALDNISALDTSFSFHGVYGEATGIAGLGTGYGVWGESTSCALNYGGYFSGDTAALMIKGHIIPFNADTYDIGDGTYKIKDIYTNSIKWGTVDTRKIYIESDTWLGIANNSETMTGIYIPLDGASGYYYGNGDGTNSHYFGSAQEFVIDYQGNLATSGTITCTGGSIVADAFGLPSLLAGTDAVFGRAAGAFDAVWRTGGTPVDYTTEAKTTRGTAISISPSNAYYINIGSTTQFTEVYFDLATAAVSFAMEVSYSTGEGTWSNFGSFTDGTSNMTVDGSVTFTAPGDWATTTVQGSAALYYIRIRSTVTTATDATVYTIAKSSNKVFQVFGNPGDTVPILGVDANGCGIVTNVGTAATFLSTITGVGITSTNGLTSTLSLSTTSTSGLIIGESSAASATTPVRYSPRFLIYGRGWDTNGAGASKINYFYNEVRPVSGDPETAFMHYVYQHDSGSATDIFKYSQTGTFYLDHIAEFTGSHTIHFDDAIEVDKGTIIWFNTGHTAYMYQDAGDNTLQWASNDADVTLGSGGDINLNPAGGYYVINNSTYRSATSLYRRYYHLPLGSFNPGASGATWVRADANTVGGWQLDAATEYLDFGSDVHADWDGESDLTVEIYWAKNTVGGTAGDTVDLKLQVFYNTTGDTATKTQTIAENVTVVGADARYKVYKSTFTIDWDATDNVVEVGDRLGFILNLETDTSECDDIIILQGGNSITYQTTHSGIESGDV